MSNLDFTFTFRTNAGHSREVYHTKRMQRVFDTAFSADSRFVLSASDDANVRIWKANASEPLKIV
jgi:WD repeat and SOF domain-containing protein 1